MFLFLAAQVTACVPETSLSIHCHPPSVKHSVSRADARREANCLLTSSLLFDSLSFTLLSLYQLYGSMMQSCFVFFLHPPLFLYCLCTFHFIPSESFFILSSLPACCFASKIALSRAAGLSADSFFTIKNKIMQREIHIMIMACL